MMRPSQRLPFSLLALALASFTAAGCPKSEPPAPPPAAPAPPPAAAPATPPPAAHADGAAAAAPAAPMKAGTATVKGTVTLTGKAPEMKMLSRGGDPFCAKTPMRDEEVMVGPGGGLKNVFVRISKGISGNYEPPMTN